MATRTPHPWTHVLPAFELIVNDDPAIASPPGPVPLAVITAIQAALAGNGEIPKLLEKRFFGLVLPPEALLSEQKAADILSKLLRMLSVRIHVIEHFDAALAHASLSNPQRGRILKMLGRKGHRHDQIMALVGEDYRPPSAPADPVQALADHLRFLADTTAVADEDPVELQQLEWLGIALPGALLHPTLPAFIRIRFRNDVLRGRGKDAEKAAGALPGLTLTGSAGDDAVLAAAIRQWYLEVKGGINAATLTRWAVLEGWYLPADPAEYGDGGWLWLQKQLAETEGDSDGEKLAQILRGWTPCPVVSPGDPNEHDQLVAEIGRRHNISLRGPRTDASVRRAELMERVWTLHIVPPEVGPTATFWSRWFGSRMLTEEAEAYIRDKAGAAGMGATLSARYPDVVTDDWFTAGRGSPREVIERRIAKELVKLIKAEAKLAKKAQTSMVLEYMKVWVPVLGGPVLFLVVMYYLVYKPMNGGGVTDELPKPGDVRQQIDKAAGKQQPRRNPFNLDERHQKGAIPAEPRE